jgi:hypothetical protein
MSRQRPNGWRDSDARKFVAAVKEAGGVVEMDAANHIKVTNPATGDSTRLPGDMTVPRNWMNSRRELQRIGIEIPKRGGSMGRRGARAHVKQNGSRASQRNFRGRVNRFMDRDSFGFITDASGQPWFFSRDDAQAGVARGELVTFQGNPDNIPMNQKYPRAYEVRLDRRNGEAVLVA